MVCLGCGGGHIATKKAHPEDRRTGQHSQKPVLDQMTDLAAQAAGTLAETAVRTAAKRARKAVANRLRGAAKSATKTLISDGANRMCLAPQECAGAPCLNSAAWSFTKSRMLVGASPVSFDRVFVMRSYRPCRVSSDMAERWRTTCSGYLACRRPSVHAGVGTSRYRIGLPSASEKTRA